ncbi:MAG: peptidoglycan editing factor PgeF [Burkholderiales bacterium]|nr:peptidoglycan editing factor PgeF [Burkholderiales bacterium]
MTCPPLDPADCLIPDWPAPANVRALCTTRAGGVSASPYDSLNLGSHVGDDATRVQRNRAILQQTLVARPVFLSQVHGTEMQELAPDTPDGAQADGAVTTARGLACTMMVADCLPILLCDAQGTRVAAVHAGWRGLAGTDGIGVVEQVVKRFRPPALVDAAQTAPELIAWLGPCIGPDAFEVGPEVLAAFSDRLPHARNCFRPLTGGKWLADLPALARQRLLAAGVSRVAGNDGSAPWCTVGNPSRFFSHRRDRGVSGRLAACIWLA